MTALKIMGVILLAFLLLSFLCVGAEAELGDGVRVRFRIGPFRLTDLPGKGKKKRKKTEPSGAEAAEKAAKPKEGGKSGLPRLSRGEWAELAGVAFGALGGTLRRACRRTRIDPLELCVTFAGDDPAEVAKSCGVAHAALWTFFPKLEELFHIPNPSVTLNMDFEGGRTRVEGTVGVSLRICDFFAIFFTLAVPVGRWLLRRWRRDAGTKRSAAGEKAPDTPRGADGKQSDAPEGMTA